MKREYPILLPIRTAGPGNHFPSEGARLLAGHEAAGPTPQLVLPLVIYQQLACCLSSTEREFQLMGFVEHDQGVFTISELVVPPHWGDAEQALMDQDAFAAFLSTQEAAGKDVGKLRLQMHSHSTANAYFSPQDIDAIRTAYACDWMVSLVGNQKLDLVARLDVFAPITLSVMMPIFIDVTGNDEQRATWLGELRASTRSTIMGFIRRVI